MNALDMGMLRSELAVIPGLDIWWWISPCGATRNGGACFLCL